MECEVRQGVECEVSQVVECEVCQGVECEVNQGVESEVCQGVECKVRQGVECFLSDWINGVSIYDLSKEKYYIVLMKSWSKQKGMILTKVCTLLLNKLCILLQLSTHYRSKHITTTVHTLQI